MSPSWCKKWEVAELHRGSASGPKSICSSAKSPAGEGTVHQQHSSHFPLLKKIGVTQSKVRHFGQWSDGEMGKKHQEQRSISLGDTCPTPLLLALKSASFPQFAHSPHPLQSQKSSSYHLSHLQPPEPSSVTNTLSPLAEIL